MTAWRPYVVNDVLKTMLRRKQSIDRARVLVMGFTFKENVPDTRNTKVADLVRSFGLHLVPRHRVRYFDGTGGGSWRGGSSHASSSLRRCT
jgi:UDP-N-acetyl-D-mannosaminuronate dehydrogenase